MKKKSIPVSPSVGLRRFLYLTAAITGGAIMIVEILGARLLAPYLGTSHFVWTAQIAVTLVALAAGYYAGGKWADRAPHLSWFYFLLIGAALFLCGTVALAETVAYGFLHLSLPLASLLTSTFLFFPPLALLATACPFLIRFLIHATDEVGGSVGRLTAISTLGSFAGTLLIGYVLVPLCANTTAMYLTAGTLMLTAAVYFAVWHRAGLPAAAAALALAAGGMSAWEEGTRRQAGQGALEELARINSHFGQLQVWQTRGSLQRFLVNDYLQQNAYDAATGQSLSTFSYMLHGLARAYTPEIRQALVIGLGVGAVPMVLANEGVEVDAVEINPAVPPLAVRFFGCDLTKIRLHIGDGRPFLHQEGKSYDAVFLDAFLGDSIPSHLMTRETFLEIARRLTPRGTLVINCFGNVNPPHNFLIASLDKTLRSVFPGVCLHTSGNGNVFFVASPQPALDMRQEPDPGSIHPAVRAEVRKAFAGATSVPLKEGILLTDNYNPAEFYDASLREYYRRQNALFIRKALRTSVP
jgi:spermidine synthase